MDSLGQDLEPILVVKGREGCFLEKDHEQNVRLDFEEQDYKSPDDGKGQVVGLHLESLG